MKFYPYAVCIDFTWLLFMSVGVRGLVSEGCGGGAQRRKAHFLLGAVQSEMTNWSWMGSY